MTKEHSKMFWNIVNLILYYFAWISAVRGAAKGDPLAGPVVATGIVFVHLFLLRSRWKQELLFILITTALGTIADSLLPALHLIEFSSPYPATFGLYPVWMSSLWAGFATTFSVSMAWIRGRYLTGALFGAIGGPGSIYAGMLLGAATVTGIETYLLASIEWAIVMIFLLAVHRRIDASLPPVQPRPI